MPQAGKNFFNRKSSFPCDTLYVTAASNKQRGGRVRPTHKKSLQTLKRVWRAVEISSGRDKAAHQSTVFLFGGLLLFLGVCNEMILHKCHENLRELLCFDKKTT